VLDQKRYSSAANLVRGAYVLSSAERPEALIAATGSEVHLALGAAEQLSAEGIGVRVVSMPSWELFERQPAVYKESVFPRSVTARVAVEAGVKMGWERYIGAKGEFVGMTSFGKSAPFEALYKGFGITVESVVSAVRRTLG
jgi:transketolase